jgi:Holliday junction resolvase RusA-like endonuclease
VRTVLRFTKPPSANNLFPTNGKTGGRRRSTEYDDWIAMAQQEVMIQRRHQHEGYVRIAYAVPRGSATADLANREKGATDLLVKMGVIQDDRLIERIFMAWSDGETQMRATITDVTGPAPRAKGKKRAQ